MTRSHQLRHTHSELDDAAQLSRNGEPDPTRTIALHSEGFVVSRPIPTPESP